MEILLLFAFIAGLVTILAPCIWPILPIILSSTTLGGKLRPLGITLGIMLSFSIFLLAISYLVRILNIDPNIFRLIAVIIIAALGLTMIIPALSAILEGWVSRLTSFFSSTTNSSNNGFWGGFLTGLSLGIVWAPCAGPILATIATLAATNQVSVAVIFVTSAYVAGVGVPLFIFAYGGQKLIQDSRFISRYTGIIQQIFGVVMILTAIAIYTNYDKLIQAKLLDLFPAYTNTLTNLENNSQVRKELDLLKGQSSSLVTGFKEDNLASMGQASEFVGINKWLNTDKPLTLKDLKGKVVLVDFWTYTCINCIRTLPYVTGWYNKYHDQGFVVVGVHTPEFEFEKNTQNVEAAIKQYKIFYPVAQDNDYATWNAYSNHYWPAKYLIDAEGNIRYTHFGEGHYDKTEEAIQTLLKEAKKEVKEDMLNLPDQTPTGELTPETYLGSARASAFFPNGRLRTGSNNFTLTSNLPLNYFSLGGQWEISEEKAVALNNATLELNFLADKVYLVMHPPESQVAKVKVMLDGKQVDQTNAGDDAKDGIINIDQPRLYNLIDLHGKKGTHKLRLEFQNPGVESFAFTFG